MQALRQVVPAALAAAALGVVAVPSYAAVALVRNIRVQDGLAGIQGSGHWTKLPGELQAALTRKLSGQMSPNGTDIRVRISQATLSRDANAGLKGPVLSGTVLLENPARQDGHGNSTPMRSVMMAYHLTITPKDAARYISAKSEEIGTAPERQNMRMAMVKSFANYVAAHL